MMKGKPRGHQRISNVISEMNEHEKAAVVHERANNGQSSVIHQQQAETSQPDHPELTRSSTC